MPRIRQGININRAEAIRRRGSQQQPTIFKKADISDDTICAASIGTLYFLESDTENERKDFSKNKPESKAKKMEADVESIPALDTSPVNAPTSNPLETVLQNIVKTPEPKDVVLTDEPARESTADTEMSDAQTAPSHPEVTVTTPTTTATTSFTRHSTQKPTSITTTSRVTKSSQRAQTNGTSAGTRRNDTAGPKRPVGRPPSKLLYQPNMNTILNSIKESNGVLHPRITPVKHAWETLFHFLGITVPPKLRNRPGTELKIPASAICHLVNIYTIGKRTHQPASADHGAAMTVFGRFEWDRGADAVMRFQYQPLPISVLPAGPIPPFLVVSRMRNGDYVRVGAIPEPVKIFDLYDLALTHDISDTTMEWPPMQVRMVVKFQALADNFCRLVNVHNKPMAGAGGGANVGTSLPVLVTPNWAHGAHFIRRIMLFGPDKESDNTFHDDVAEAVRAYNEAQKHAQSLYPPRDFHSIVADADGPPPVPPPRRTRSGLSLVASTESRPQWTAEKQARLSDILLDRTFVEMGELDPLACVYDIRDRTTTDVPMPSAHLTPSRRRLSSSLSSNDERHVWRVANEIIPKVLDNYCVYPENSWLRSLYDARRAVHAVLLGETTVNIDHRRVVILPFDMFSAAWDDEQVIVESPDDEQE